MGQRLNIEIWNNGKVLANAYYHWSGFTGCAAELTTKILKNISKSSDFSVMYAVKLLEETGAGINDDEKLRIIEEERIPVNMLRPCNDRNSGLISVTEYGINETRFWEEGRVTIYLDERRVKFDVFIEDKRYDWERKQAGEYTNPKEVPKVNVDFSDIKFEKFEETFRAISDLVLNGDTFISEVNPRVILIPIE